MNDIEPRPSNNCGTCTRYEKEGFKECYCSCHTIGNLVNGFHENINVTPIEITSRPLDRNEFGEYPGDIQVKLKR